MFLEHLHLASPGKLEGSSISGGKANCVGLMAAAALTKVSRGESDTSNSLPPEQTLFSLVSDLITIANVTHNVTIQNDEMPQLSPVWSHSPLTLCTDDMPSARWVSPLHPASKKPATGLACHPRPLHPATRHTPV
ncbi:hypothetical protein E2C01_016341 [Portunus trituberculatus]|uniref:Uncharacterized protein n=1 Tax=Portunus trituberculatus TaxID=210409 RepID=A0A5B7DPB0_PORTR|nr:hypothetical protein [Portunus trituberculatus]